MSILSFQMPERVVMEKANDFHGLFTFKPLEIGYGVTIGNALRRILLSSLEGYAITAVKVSSVQHEFSTIKGVVEDMSEIILNLKSLRFKKISDVKDEKIIVQVSNQEEFRGSDIAKFTHQFEILNPDLLIFTCDNSVTLEIELLINKGRGYLPAEESTIPTETIGLIPIDSIFTPIKNVKYVVENTRVKQKTDYEQLILDIETDGSIHPENALKEASNILIKHFMLFSDKSIILETEKEKENAEVDEEILKKRKLLKTPLNDLDLSVRAYNCLKAADVKTLGDLAQLEISDMMKFRNFGKKSLSELEELIAEKNLTFGIDTSVYKLEEE